MINMAWPASGQTQGARAGGIHTHTKIKQAKAALRGDFGFKGFGKKALVLADLFSGLDQMTEQKNIYMYRLK